VKWTVIGAAGMLGTDLLQVLRERGYPYEGLDFDEVDITDAGAVDELDLGEVVVNCAAYTAVDQAETEERSAFAINAVGAANVAAAARRRGALLVQISTDYVFDGSATQPYPEDAPTAPASAYGRTKLAGEWGVRAFADRWYIVRTAWLYGAHGPCFPKTMARLARENGTVSVVTDQIGQPTWTVDLADLVVRMVEANVPTGIYHGTASGQVSWHGFTREIVSAIGLDPELVGETTSAAFARPAPRPAYSVLDHDALTAAGVAPIGDWRDRWAMAATKVLR
jgi:dTDP-4-dehydrorhamnose reductase